MTACVDCGAPFYRGADEDWKVRCVPCWRRHKGLRADRLAELLAENDRLREHAVISAELAAQLPRLLQLCHPDRHGGSPASVTATQWLLERRRVLGARR